MKERWGTIRRVGQRGHSAQPYRRHALGDLDHDSDLSTNELFDLE